MSGDQDFLAAQLRDGIGPVEDSLGLSCGHHHLVQRIEITKYSNREEQTANFFDHLVVAARCSPRETLEGGEDEVRRVKGEDRV
jgi:hypothetical protein